MLDGFTRHSVRSILALLVLITGLLGYGVFRLSQGPVPLDFVLEPLERALSALSGNVIQVRQAALSWDSTHGDLGLELGGVSVSTPEGSRLLTLPRAWLEFSGQEMLRGRFQPTVLRLNGLTLRGTRGANGGFSLGIQADSEAAAPADPPQKTEDTRTPAQWLTDVFQLGRPNGLRQVRLHDSRIVLIDERMNVEWQLSDISATLQADSAGNPLGGMEGILILPGRQTRISLSGMLDLADPLRPEDDLWKIQADIADLIPSSIAARLPGLPELSGLELPTQVKAEAVLDGKGLPQAVSAKLALGAGRLVHADLPTGALAITSGAIDLALKNSHLDIEINNLTLGTGTSLTGRLALDRLRFPFKLEAHLGVKSVRLADLPLLWPAGVAPNPRRWIFANLSKGAVSEAVATLKATFPGRDVEPEIHDLTAALSAANIDVTYLGKLPPVEGVGGNLTYTHSDGRLAMTLQDGRVRGGLAVPKGNIAITGLKAKDQHLALTMGIEGPVSEALALLDAPPLGFMKRFGVDSKQSAGAARITLVMGFPLINALKVEQLDVSAEAMLTDAALRNVIEDVSLSEAALALKVTPKGLTGTGTGKLNGVGFQIDWQESFADAGRKLGLIGTVDDSGRRALNLPGAGYVSGPIDLALTYDEPKPRQAKVDVKADLTRARVEVADIHYVKLPGEVATGTATLVMENNRLTQISAFDYRTATGRGATGAVQFDNKMTITNATLSRIHLPGTDLAASFKRGRDGWTIDLDGRSLDLSPVMAERAKRPPGPPSPPLSVTLTAKLESLTLGPKREARGVRARLAITQDVWNELGFSAKIGEGNATATISGKGADRRFALDSADAGAFLGFSGAIGTVRGGTLNASGQPDAEGWRGQMKMTAYRLLEEPVLGRILAIASITGIPELLQGEGIAFESATLDYRLTPQKITLANGRTTGLSVGLKLDGAIDRATEKLDLYGTLVPMAGINRVIGAIPLLGTLLTGGDGGGVFAWTFTVTGQMASPQVSVNPLSGFAPGILRSIFEGSSGSSPAGNGSVRPPPPPTSLPGDR